MSRPEGTRLGGVAKRLGITQEGLAARLRPPVTQSTVQRWFQADTVPAEYQEQVASILEVRLEWLVTNRGAAEIGPEEEREARAFDAGFAAGLRKGLQLIAGALQDASMRVSPAPASDGDEAARLAALVEALQPPEKRSPSRRGSPRQRRAQGGS